MLDTIINKDKPTAASQAANTKRVSGSIIVDESFIRSILMLRKIKIDNIIPSKHRRDDIKWERYMNRPTNAIIYARITLRVINCIW